MSVRQKDVPRCGYCASDSHFRPMRVLENDRQICESCGHIVIPEGSPFLCPCQRCVEARFSSRLQLMKR